MTEPALGDFFVVRTEGWQAAAIRWGTESTVNHAGVYVGDGMVVEAEPAGAVLSPVTNYAPDTITWSQWPLQGAAGPSVAAHARALVGTPYGWPDIAAIVLGSHRLLVPLVNCRLADAQQPWWVRRLTRTDRLICSQLVDYAYFLAGVHLFDDGRPFGLVSPGDLLTLTNGRSKTT